MCIRDSRYYYLVLIIIRAITEEHVKIIFNRKWIEDSSPFTRGLSGIIYQHCGELCRRMHLLAIRTLILTDVIGGTTNNNALIWLIKWRTWRAPSITDQVLYTSVWRSTLQLTRLRYNSNLVVPPFCCLDNTARHKDITYLQTYQISSCTTAVTELLTRDTKSYLLALGTTQIALFSPSTELSF